MKNRDFKSSFQDPKKIVLSSICVFLGILTYNIVVSINSSDFAVTLQNRLLSNIIPWLIATILVTVTWLIIVSKVKKDKSGQSD